MSKIRAHSTLSQQYSVVKTYMKYLPVVKEGDQNKLETEALLFTRNNRRSGAFCTAFIAEMDVFFPLLSQILRPFGKWIKDDFYHVLKFEHRSMISVSILHGCYVTLATCALGLVSSYHVLLPNGGLCTSRLFVIND